MKSNGTTIFEDISGKIWDSNDLDELTIIEIEALGLHVAEA